LEMIEDGSIQLVVNMAWSKAAIEDDKFIRLAANKMKVPCITTMAGFHALVLGLQAVTGGPVHVESLQNYNARLVPATKTPSAVLDDAGDSPEAVGEAA